MTPNTEQQEVIESRASNILCIAGAGSGKTATLVARIARLIHEGAAPASMVVITYTNAAARELTERIKPERICKCGEPWNGHHDNHTPVEMEQQPLKLGYCGTLHGFLLRLLTAQHQLVGLPSKLSVLDDDQKTGMMETIRDEMNSKASIKAILPLLTRPDLIAGGRGGNRTRDELVAVEYHARLRAAGLLDFDTILFYGERLIRGLDAWSYKFLFVDEFQDSANADANIYEAMPCSNKFFVGDDSQAIYSFRGGNVGRMMSIAKGAPENGFTVFKLQTNYRCLSKICDAANRLIGHNANRYPKLTLAAREGGEVTVERCSVEASELGYVLDEIENSINLDSIHPQEIAILCRTNSIAKTFADYLEARGIPVARKKFAEVPPDFKKAKMFLTVLANRYNDMAVYQFVTEASGKKFADAARTEAAKKMCALYEVAMPQMKGADGKNPVSELGIAGISAESRERIHDAARLLSAAGDWTINDLLLFLNAQEETAATVGSGVTVCTVHQFKGREAKIVHVVGFEESLFPMTRKDSSEDEERRLAYVAVTRAKEKLFISWCETRPKPFSRDTEQRQPSRFIAEAGLHYD